MKSKSFLSIKNRYNHALLEGNPDATYKNNLENIAPGLTKSFENTYGLVEFNPNTNFEIKDYVRGKDGKFYKYNYLFYVIKFKKTIKIQQ